MKRKQQRRDAVPLNSNTTSQQPAAMDHWQPILLGTAVALVIATPLINSDPTLAEGSHVVLVIAWLLLLVAWLATHALDRRVPAIRVDAIGVTVIAFFLWHSLSGLLMAGAGHARWVLNAIWVWITFGVAFLVIRDLVRTPRVLRTLLSVLVASGVGLAAFGIYEYAISMPRERAIFHANPERVIEAMGIEAPPGSPMRRQLIDRIESTEPNATFALTNSLAGFLVPPTVLVLGILVSVWTGVTNRWRGWLGLLVAGTVLVACLLMTKSRAASLAVIVGVIAIVATTAITRYARRPAVWVAVGGMTALVIAGALVAAFETGVWDRQVLTEASKSMRYRFEFWDATDAMIRAHRWLGCGPGNFKLFYPQYKLPQASETVAEPHNFLLEIASTSGLPGLALFLLVGGLLVWKVFRRGTFTLVISAAAKPVDDTRVVRAIYIGTAVGLVLAYVAGGVAMQFPDLALPWVWGPTVAITLWLLHPWARDGRMPFAWLGISLAALLVNLLAAGGIGFPGVGLCVWVLAALVGVVIDMSRGDDRPRTLGPRTTWLALVSSMALFGAAYFTMYRPVLGAKRELAQARTTGDVKQIIRHLQAAADNDRWWARPYVFAAQVCQREWISSPAANWQLAFDQSVRLALRRQRHSYDLNQHKGDWLLEVYAAKGGDVLLKRAVDAYDAAVLFYPNSNFLHAQLAWALYLDGQHDRAQAEAVHALTLDALNPHKELKLAARRLIGQIMANPTSVPPDATAEQSMLFLRNLKRAE